MTIPSFHAHIYYDDQTRHIAAEVREALGRNFDVVLGHWHDQPVGPHPQAMFQVAFMEDHFNGITQWLMLNRRGLTIFLHPETGSALADHSEHAIWMGRILELDMEVLKNLEA